MAFKQKQLPYDLNALDPFVSEEQMHYHYDMHHKKYFELLNGLIAGQPEDDMSLLDVVLSSSGKVFNNAAQAWNHAFFWDCMSPNGGGKPNSELISAISRDFQSFENFKEEFSKNAAALFGSGWTWLATDKNGNLKIMPLSNAETPLKHNGFTPILTLDVWEHAYYIDYRNRRPDFIEGFWDVINWNFVERSYNNARTAAAQQ